MGILVLLHAPPSLAFTSAETAAARAAIVAMDHGKWDEARSVAARARFPLLVKLVAWFDLTRPGSPAGFADYSGFIGQNQDWPAQNLLKRHAEDAMPDAMPADRVIAWFRQSPAQGPIGAGRYLDTLLASGQRAEAETFARQFLTDGAMSAADVAEFAGRFQALLRPVDFGLRADRLIWAGNIDDATLLLPYLPSTTRTLAQARIALATQSMLAPASLSRLSSDQQTDPGVLFERVRWLRRQNHDPEAIALLATAPATTPHAEAWWGERIVLTRRALENKDGATAYALVRDHRQATTPVALADGEWLAGWIAFRYLNDPKTALGHFERMLDGVAAPISIARAAYWAGRTEEALGDRLAAERYYARASTHMGAFYGLIALAKLNPSAKLILPAEPSVPALDARTFENRELVQIAELLSEIGLASRADPFIRRVGELARTPADSLLALRLAKAINSPPAQIQFAKRLMQGGMPVLPDGYPVIPRLVPKSPEPALIHAIIRQESLFDAGAISPSGALGLMQLMPATAKNVAAKLRIKRFSPVQLTASPGTNLTLGSNYLADLVDRFGGSYVLAIAGYNAGPGRVAGWVRDNGDPRSSLDGTIDWIEKIDVPETRNYVQRVIENLEIYRARLSGGSTANGIAHDLVR